MGPHPVNRYDDVEVRRVLAELGLPNSKFSVRSPSVQWLVEEMEKKDISIMEFLCYVFMKRGPPYVNPGTLAKRDTWEKFLHHRSWRISDNEVKIAGQIRRISNILDSRFMTLQELLESPVDELSALLKYVVANKYGLNFMKEQFYKGAVFELETCPEIAGFLKEFGEENLPRRTHADKD